MLPKTRLGKRSPLGALLSPAAGPRADQETGEAGVTMATAAEHQAVSRVKGHPGLKVRGAQGTLLLFNNYNSHESLLQLQYIQRKPLTVRPGVSSPQVYFQCGGESSGLVDQLDFMQSDVWPSSHPCSSCTSSCSSSVPPSSSRSVSSCIDVPRRCDITASVCVVVVVFYLPSVIF